jgi:hypothetical protein
LRCLTADLTGMTSCPCGLPWMSSIPGAMTRLAMTGGGTGSVEREEEEPERTGNGTVVRDGGADGAPESVDVLALGSEDLQTVALEGLGDVVALEVLGWVARDGHIVIVLRGIRRFKRKEKDDSRTIRSLMFRC